MSLRIDPSDRIIGGASVVPGPGLRVEPRERPHFTQPKRDFQIQLPLRAMAIGAGVIVVIGLVIWFFVSRPSATQQAEAEIAVIRASTYPYKVRVDDQSVPSVHHQDKRVYDRLGKAREAVQEEVLIPAPEAPIEVGQAPLPPEPRQDSPVAVESLVDVMTPEKIVEKVAGSVPISSKPLPAISPKEEAVALPAIVPHEEAVPLPNAILLEAGVDEGIPEDVVVTQEMSMEDLINEEMKLEAVSEKESVVELIPQSAVVEEVMAEEEGLSQEDPEPVHKVFRSDGAVLDANKAPESRSLQDELKEEISAPDEDPLASLIGDVE